MILLSWRFLKQLLPKPSNGMNSLARAEFAVRDDKRQQGQPAETNINIKYEYA
jgi:hypothetical protein